MYRFTCVSSVFIVINSARAHANLYICDEFCFKKSDIKTKENLKKVTARK